VDLRHDVTVGDLGLAVRENYHSVEHVKRYTTLGMSVDQGKTSVPAIEIIAALQNVSPADVGYTTMRPPFTPVTLGAIAAHMRDDGFAPWRQTPLHAWHVAHGATLEDYGEWKRPACYLYRGESRDSAIDRECSLVRGSAGLYDASSLGKIEVHGPDAQEFLERFYINRLDTLRPGRARYSIMLRETGTIFDDGTVSMLTPTHFLLTTTSGNSSRVAAWLEEWKQCEWPALRVAIVPVTEHWATLTLSGPQSRNILARLRPECDLTSENFPHLDLRVTTILDTPARICRVSFTGELTYEINVPVGSAGAIWETLLAEGAGYGLGVFGVEALLRLRLEKGYLHLGADTDGTTVPDDVGWGAVASAKKRDFIGKRSLSLPANVRSDRFQLVGLRAAPSLQLIPGFHLRVNGTSGGTDGWVTSAGRLTSDATSIGLASIRAGRSLIDSIVAVFDGGAQVGTAKIVSPPFYDPEGARMHA